MWRWGRRSVAGNHSAAQHRIAVVKDGGLPRCDGALRLLETHHCSVANGSYGCRRLGEFVANLDGNVQLSDRGHTGNPRHRHGVQVLVIQLILRTHNHLSGVRFQPDDEARRPSGQAEAATLPDREILDAIVLGQHIAGVVNDVAGIFIGALPDELAIVAGGYEADVLAVGLVGVGEAGVGSQLANVRLGIMTNRHQGGHQLILTHPEQHVGLVFVGVGSAKQRPAAGAVRFDAGVVASGNVAGAHQPGPLGQETELYLVIAGDAGVGGAARFHTPAGSSR